MIVQLIPRRQPDLQQGFRDYHIYAGEQRVGRIYQTHKTGWWWGINSVMLDMTVGVVLQGYVGTQQEAQKNLRTAFDVWLAWALAMPASDLKFEQIDKNLKAIGVR